MSYSTLAGEPMADWWFCLQEAIEKKSFFDAGREIVKGDVTEGFKMADEIHEGVWRTVDICDTLSPTHIVL